MPHSIETQPPGHRMITRLRAFANSAFDTDAAVFAEAADKMERLLTAVGSAKIALLNRHGNDLKLVEQFSQAALADIDEALTAIDQGLDR